MGRMRRGRMSWGMRDGDWGIMVRLRMKGWVWDRGAGYGRNGRYALLRKSEHG